MTFSQGSKLSEEDNVDIKEDDGAKGPDEEDSHKVRHTGSEPEIDDILHDDYQVPTPKPTGIIQWLDKVYKSSRGFELGTFDASIIPGIWKQQSANWYDIALGYVSDIVFLIHHFILALISAICDDQRVQSALVSLLMDGLKERYMKSIDHAKFILHVERGGTPMTANRHFADNLEKR